MKLVLYIFILSVSFGAFSQDTLVVFDRPGVADSPYLVPEKNLLFRKRYRNFRSK